MARSQEQSEVNPGPGGEGLPGDHPQKFNVDTVPRIEREIQELLQSIILGYSC